jgi:hypothetical protein
MSCITYITVYFDDHCDVHQSCHHHTVTDNRGVKPRQLHNYRQHQRSPLPVMPLNRPVPCIRCGQAFNQGWATINHHRVCIPDDLEAVIQSSDEAVIQSSDDDANVPVLDLEEYFERLERAGTLDTQHILQYLSWKRRPLTAEILEICKFLRSVECGGGSSDGGALHVLRYAKSLGGSGDLLPKTIDTCWSKISKVL